MAEAEIVRVVRDYVQAFEREDIDALRDLLTADATQLDARGHGSPTNLIEFWRMRMRSYDYSKLAGTEVFRPERVERFAYDELEDHGEVHRPAEMRPDDVLVRVPIETPRLGGDRLFGDVVVLLLRREEGRFKIAGFTEEEPR